MSGWRRCLAPAKEVGGAEEDHQKGLGAERLTAYHVVVRGLAESYWLDRTTPQSVSG